MRESPGVIPLKFRQTGRKKHFDESIERARSKCARKRKNCFFFFFFERGRKEEKILKFRQTEQKKYFEESIERARSKKEEALLLLLLRKRKKGRKNLEVINQRKKERELGNGKTHDMQKRLHASKRGRREDSSAECSNFRVSHAFFLPIMRFRHSRHTRVSHR